MNTNYISKIFSGAIFSGLLLLGLFGFSASNAQAQLGKFQINKDFCDEVGQQNTCNSSKDGFPDTVTFTIERGTFNVDTGVFTSDGSVFSNVIVPVKKNANGTFTTDEIFTAGDTFRVCEIPVPGFIPIPRPGDSTGGSGQFENGSCIVFVEIGSGNNIFKFVNLRNRPTAASVTVRGRVLSPFGRGVSRSRVMITDSTGQTRTVMTNPFGFYTFGNIEVGGTYILQVRDKRYTYTPQAISLTEEATDVNFIAQR